MKKLMLGTVAVAMFGLSMTANAAEADRRENRQEARIVQGERNGTINPVEAAKLQRKEAKIDREVARDRARNGGYLTPAEKAKINAEQNQASRAIRRAKTNGR